MFEEKIDILEDKILSFSPRVLKVLLEDKTTKRNILWATDDYFNIYGDGFAKDQEIYEDFISGLYNMVIQPRIEKEKNKQINRTKKMAEVFTPAWICNAQNNLVDNLWFGKTNVFNTEHDRSWTTNNDKIEFKKTGDRTWREYVLANRLEITCGEAPYLVSRYDNSTGEAIELKNRIGILDRKLRVVNENAKTEPEWQEWAQKAFESTYGYEYQGDNVILARENLLYTYTDNLRHFLNRDPLEKEVLKIANIIAWNIWQMDGLSYTPPSFNKETKCKSGKTSSSENFTLCKIKDWRSKKTIIFKSLIRCR